MELHNDKSGGSDPTFHGRAQERGWGDGRGGSGGHKKDLEVQDRYGVKYLRYWLDESTGRIFCLAEAPSKEATVTVHREAHGLLADEIHQVTEGS